MKCDYKQCKNEHLTEMIECGKKEYHQECKIDMDQLTKTSELYVKYVNPKESWNVMKRSLHNWYKQHEAEYILFCMSKAIRRKKKFTNFFSFYYVLNDLTYIKMYEDYKNKEETFVFENVHLRKSEYAELVKYMGDNNAKLEWYIRKLNEYMLKTGREYDSHKETLISWYDKEELVKPVKTKNNII